MKTQDICRLCYTHSLLRESHIIPSSILSLVRDKTMNNRFYKIGINTDQVIQDGPKEYLLCDECEQKIGHYEKFFKEAVHLSRHGARKFQVNRIMILNNLDYTKIKLFLLSVLWRMSISSLPQFSDVSLESDEEKIRKLIHEDNPGKSQDYPIAGIVPLIDGKMEESWMCFPIVADTPDGYIYYMIIGGILYLIAMTQHDQYFTKWLLKESGNWAMPTIDFYKIPFLKNFVDSIFC